MILSTNFFNYYEHIPVNFYTITGYTFNIPR